MSRSLLLATSRCPSHAGVRTRIGVCAGMRGRRFRDCLCPEAIARRVRFGAPDRCRFANGAAAARIAASAWLHRGAATANLATDWCFDAAPPPATACAGSRRARLSKHLPHPRPLLLRLPERQRGRPGVRVEARGRVVRRRGAARRLVPRGGPRPRRGLAVSGRRVGPPRRAAAAAPRGRPRLNG